MKQGKKKVESTEKKTTTAAAGSALSDLLCSSCKYKELFTSISCLFAEGVEFMTKEQIYNAIKKEVKSLEA